MIFADLLNGVTHGRLEPSLVEGGATSKNLLGMQTLDPVRGHHRGHLENCPMGIHLTMTSLTMDEHIAALRPKLISFARLQLRDHAAAEDTVQETLITAIEKQGTFNGRSAFETWVFGILKNKLLERIRHERRYVAWQNDTRSDEDALDHLFKEDGHWHAAHQPRHWGEPDHVLENEAFWQLLDMCLIALPDNTARVFTMRELMELTTQEICQILSISEANCWVILHRARLKLRACIEKGWLTER